MRWLLCHYDDDIKTLVNLDNVENIAPYTKGKGTVISFVGSNEDYLYIKDDFDDVCKCIMWASENEGYKEIFE